ncbi:hypothetical protein [Streptomyces virginiae]|uniref:hypothetical protein n=1 Tax=Streptomyces virginiae TaxID=1961 RepID=UPI003702DE49
MSTTKVVSEGSRLTRSASSRKGIGPLISRRAVACDGVRPIVAARSNTCAGGVLVRVQVPAGAVRAGRRLSSATGGPGVEEPAVPGGACAPARGMDEQQHPVRRADTGHLTQGGVRSGRWSRRPAEEMPTS